MGAVDGAEEVRCLVGGDKCWRYSHPPGCHVNVPNGFLNRVLMVFPRRRLGVHQQLWFSWFAIGIGLSLTACFCSNDYRTPNAGA